VKPTVPEVLPLVNALYQEHAAGCCLHIVLDDANVEDHSVQFCLEQAKKEGHPRCIELAEKLLLMSRTQRHRLYQFHS
jgi:hypothetical protein